MSKEIAEAFGLALVDSRTIEWNGLLISTEAWWDAWANHPVPDKIHTRSTDPAIMMEAFRRTVSGG